MASSLDAPTACDQAQCVNSPLDAARQSVAARFHTVRANSLALTASLSAEDQCIQSMPDASPTKWHLAHTSWFFEALILREFATDYQPFDERFFYLFNSYYEALGERQPRAQRGLLSRPSLAEVQAYRAHVDAGIDAVIAHCPDASWPQCCELLVLGFNHEEQHQELIQTDILHALWCNPMSPAFLPAAQPNGAAHTNPSAGNALSNAEPLRWITPTRAPTHTSEASLFDIGHALAKHTTEAGGESAFCFDNETPRHKVYLAPYAVAHRLVTNSEYAAFIADGGYQRPEFWLSDGWAMVQQQALTHPLYWQAARPSSDQGTAAANAWQTFGPHGFMPLAPHEPVSHLCFYEAAAYAQWAGARLPTEFEWEAAFGAPGLLDMLGVVWQWTRSSYDPYPGFRPLPGAPAEYNGKFMVGQLVLRGSSRATPAGHSRQTYRNFFAPSARWQFAGLRLAKDL